MTIEGVHVFAGKGSVLEGEKEWGEGVTMGIKGGGQHNIGGAGFPQRRNRNQHWKGGETDLECLLGRHRGKKKKGSWLKST